MTKTTPGRPTTAEDEMIQDIIDTPIEEIREELRDEGLDPNEVAARLRDRLARAQDTVIQRRLDAARTQSTRAKASVRAEAHAPKKIDGAYSAEGLTMAARNATRPMGLSDPSVDEDLDELDADEWTRD